MSKAVEKPYNNGQWTHARFNSFVKGWLRKASTRWPPKYQALKTAEVGKKTNKLTGRLAMHYGCAHCDGEFPAKQVSVDHILPVIDPVKGFESWDEVIRRLFCEADGLQVLCKTCHDSKSKEERALRPTKR